MIPAVAQTLAKILTRGTSLASAEQIDFSHPGIRQDVRPSLTLYPYHIEQSQSMSGFGHSHRQDYRETHRVPETSSVQWFDVSFLLMAWDYTALGEQRLLSEALSLLSQHYFLPEESLASVLQGHGALPTHLSHQKLTDSTAFWRALGVPLRPALHVTVTVPFRSSRKPESGMGQTLAPLWLA